MVEKVIGTEAVCLVPARFGEGHLVVADSPAAPVEELSSVVANSVVRLVALFPPEPFPAWLASAGVAESESTAAGVQILLPSSTPVAD